MKFVNKYEVEKSFHEWLEGFKNNTRFDISINWENSFCVQNPIKNRDLHKEQQKIIGDNNE